MIRRRHLAPVAAAAATALLLAGCGGGGGGGAPPRATSRRPTPRCRSPRASVPEQSASLAIAALGSPGCGGPRRRRPDARRLRQLRHAPRRLRPAGRATTSGSGSEAGHRRRRSRPTRRSTATRSWRSRATPATATTPGDARPTRAPARRSRTRAPSRPTSTSPASRSWPARATRSRPTRSSSWSRRSLATEVVAGAERRPAARRHRHGDAQGGRVDHPLQRDRQAQLQDQAGGRARGLAGRGAGRREPRGRVERRPAGGATSRSPAARRQGVGAASRRRPRGWRRRRRSRSGGSAPSLGVPAHDARRGVPGAAGARVGVGQLAQRSPATASGSWVSSSRRWRRRPSGKHVDGGDVAVGDRSCARRAGRPARWCAARASAPSPVYAARLHPDRRRRRRTGPRRG